MFNFIFKIILLEIPSNYSNKARMTLFTGTTYVASFQTRTTNTCVCGCFAGVKHTRKKNIDKKKAINYCRSLTAVVAITIKFL